MTEHELEGDKQTSAQVMDWHYRWLRLGYRFGIAIGVSLQIQQLWPHRRLLQSVDREDVNI